MKKLTFLKLILSITGWIILFQLMPLGLNMLSKPSDVAPILGSLILIATIGTMFYCAACMGKFAAKLLSESRESRLEKIREQFKKENEI